ncbi:MAG: glycosyltransferase family 4 protein [Solirubrobacteraceae bacterium]
MRAQLVDPSAFTPPYDRALAAALARVGVEVELVTSAFAYGDVPAAEGYVVRELFYRHAIGAPGSSLRRLAKLAEHVPDMLRWRALASGADVVHLQWLTAPVLDVRLLPDRPLVLTAHDLLPREPRPGQLRAQRRVFERVDAIVVHSRYGADQLTGRLGVPAERVHVIHHGAFLPGRAGELPAELHDTGAPVILFTGLLRPYKGLGTLLAAWRGVADAQLWIVGRPMIDLAPLRAQAPPGVSFVPRFVGEPELQALLARADIVVLPYERTERFDQSGVLAAALGHGRAIVLTDIGGFSEVAELGAARLVAPGDPDELRVALLELIGDRPRREQLGAAALAAAHGRLSWDAAARATVALYEQITG